MDWLLQADERLFRLINHSWSNPVFDRLMPFLSGNVFFIPALVLLAVSLLMKGGRQGRCFVVAMTSVLILGEALVTGPLKKSFGRERPYTVLQDVELRAGKSASKAMPSGHSALWAAAATVTFLFYRRVGRGVAVVALGVGYSRCYVGVHWPTDVIAGFIVGISYGCGIAWGLEFAWKRLGRSFLPIWWGRVPSLLHPMTPPVSIREGDRGIPTVAHHWLRLGWAVIGLLLVVRLGYLSAGIIELSEDEAYQWVWSKHPDWSYYSKPPFIAYAHWLGTHIAGDRELGVRLLSPLLSALLSILAFKFVTRHTSARTAFWFLLAMQATPLLVVGSILITIDPITVVFWTLAMFSGWRAITEDSTRQWVLTGLWLGGSFLSKYFSPFQWACFAIFFILCPAARGQLRRPGPWLALGINVLCMVPVVIWNQQNGWITVRHLSERGGLNKVWSPTLRFFGDFVVSEPFLLNPFFFAAIVWMLVRLWKERRREASPNPTPPPNRSSGAVDWDRQWLVKYLLCMGVPVFLFYFFYTFRARVQPNWICTSVLPLFLATVIYGYRASLAGSRAPRRFLIGGLALGLPIAILLHDTNLVAKIAGKPLPISIDPLRRLRGHRDSARIVEEELAKFQRPGVPAFVIANHYGITGLLNFYMPSARSRLPDNPLVCVRSSDHAENQFWFWPRFRYLGTRVGHDAIYVQDIDERAASLDRVRSEFESVTEIGDFEVKYRDRVCRRWQLLACRGLKAVPTPVAPQMPVVNP